MTNTYIYHAGQGAVRVGSHLAAPPEWLYLVLYQCWIWLLCNLTCLQVLCQQRDYSSSLTQG